MRAADLAIRPAIGLGGNPCPATIVPVLSQVHSCPQPGGYLPGLARTRKVAMHRAWQYLIAFVALSQHYLPESGWQFLGR
jgi:hypothetical protein